MLGVDGTGCCTGLCMGAFGVDCGGLFLGDGAGDGEGDGEGEEDGDCLTGEPLLMLFVGVEGCGCWGVLGVLMTSFLLGDGDGDGDADDGALLIFTCGLTCLPTTIPLSGSLSFFFCGLAGDAAGDGDGAGVCTGVGEADCGACANCSNGNGFTGGLAGITIFLLKSLSLASSDLNCSCACTLSSEGDGAGTGEDVVVVVVAVVVAVVAGTFALLFIVSFCRGG